MSRYGDTVIDENNRPIPGAQVYVYRSKDETLASLTEDGGGVLGNPVTSDRYGNYYFNAPAGIYILEYWFGGKRVLRRESVPVGVVAAVIPTGAEFAGKFVVGDAEGEQFFPSAGTGADAGLRDDLTASGGASLVSYLPAGGGAVSSSVQQSLRDALYINPKNFRVPADPDDRLSIIRAAAYAKTLRSADGGTVNWPRRQPVLHFPPNLEFESAQPIAIPGHISVIMESPLLITAAPGVLPTAFGEDAWLDIGKDVIAYNNGSRWCRYDISVMRKLYSNWSSVNDLGVRIQNINSCDVILRRVIGFCRNFEFYAGEYAVSYNEVTILESRGAKYHGTLNAGPYFAPFNEQFVNANRFYGGEFANSTGELVAGQDIFGWWLKGGNESTYNSNEFDGQSYEMHGTGAGVTVPVWIEGKAEGCRWTNQRTEGSINVHMRISHAETRNCWFDDTYYGYDSTSFDGRLATVEDNSYSQANFYSNLADLPLRQASIPVWDSGMLYRRSNQYNGAAQYAVGGFDVSDSSFAMAPARDLIDISGTVIRHESGRDLVRWLDTTINKRFLILVDTGAASKTWNPRFRPYNGANALLSSNPANPYVMGVDSDAFSWNGGVYGTGAYVAAGGFTAHYLFVRFREEVKRAALCLIGSGTIAGGDAAQVRTVKIVALDSPCSSYIETRHPFDNGEFIGTAPPTTGAWLRGARIYNFEPAASGVEGWVCVAGGSPGTWKAFGSIAA